MRAVVITRHGDPSVLLVRERPDPPPPAPRRVHIAVRAAAVNFADHLARVGPLPGRAQAARGCLLCMATRDRPFALPTHNCTTASQPPSDLLIPGDVAPPHDRLEH
jgi:hypothetical protein